MEIPVYNSKCDSDDAPDVYRDLKRLLRRLQIGPEYRKIERAIA